MTPEEQERWDRNTEILNRPRGPFGYIFARKPILILPMIILVAAVCIGAWWLERTVHYRLSYQDMVRETIREMVKDEALKEQTR